ncbi:O-antigen ligase family protein [bacterium]|nr:O-antigen ligase family protein [bacterium]
MLQQLQKVLTKNTILPALVAAVIFALPFERIPSIDAPLFGMNITFRLSLFFCSALMLVAVPRIWRERAKLKDPAFYLLFGFMFMYFLSVLLSADLKRAVAVWVFTAFTCFTAVALAFIYRDTKREWINRAIYISTWIVLAFGFYQYFGDLLGLSASWTGLRDIYSKSVLGFPRIQSTGLEPLYYANYLTIPLMYFSVKFLHGDEERPFLIALIATQLVLTVSRGALLAGAAGFILLLIIVARKIRYTQTLGLLGLVLVGVALALNISNFKLPQSSTSQSQSNPSAVRVVEQATNYVPQDDRVRNRELAIRAFMEQPFLGIGPGNFSEYSKRNVELYRSWTGYIIANNEPAELLAEGGIINFSLLLGFFALLWVRILRMSWHNVGPDHIWPAVIAGFFVTMAIQYQTFSTLYVIHLWVLVGIALALTTPSLQATTTGSKVVADPIAARTVTTKAKKNKPKKRAHTRKRSKKK